VLPFAGMTIDRATELRTDQEWVAAQMQLRAAQIVAGGSGGVLVAGGERPVLLRRSLHGAGQAGALGAEPVLLGLEGDAPLFAVDLDQLAAVASERLLDGATLVGLREAGARLSAPEAALAAYLTAMLSWHRAHGFCANCGSRSELRQGGAMRRCPNCGAEHFPRVDPVVIMVVENSGRLLLGRHARWPAGQYSALAGFVAPGESLEEAVAREVREESGIAVDRVSFVASQPWPFPSSVMLGFEALAHDGDPAPLDGELEDVRWFSSEVVRAALADMSPELRLPPKISIARFLIERWDARSSRRAVFDR
jgi:NAD+ diphosphatase